SARRRRLRRGGAAHLQGGGRFSGLSEGTARSLPARHPDDEPARSWHSANVRDGGPPAARPRAAEVAVLTATSEDLASKAWHGEVAGDDRERGPDLPVMMVTAYGDDQRRRHAAEVGALQFLTKPVDFDFLKEELHR